MLLAIVLHSCKEQPIVKPGKISTPDATWTTIQEKIWDAKCVNCHTEGTSYAKQSGLILTTDVAYKNLMNVTPHNAAAANDGLKLLEGDGMPSVFNSFLWEKVNALNQEHFYEDHPEYGAIMPLGTPLTNGEIEYIRRWIVAKAPETGYVVDTALLLDTTIFVPSKDFEPLTPPKSGYQMHLGPFEVIPNFERELYSYQSVGNTTEVYVNHIETAMRPGTHHLILYDFADNATLPQNDIIRDIRNPNNGLNINTLMSIKDQVFVFGTQFRSTDYRYPPGVALKIPAYKSFDLNSHYTNYSTTSETGEVYVNLHTIAKNQVQHEAQELFLNKDNFSLPANQRTTITSEYTFNDQRHIFMLTAHAHQLMEEFKIYIIGGDRDGDLIYYTNDWEHPQIQEYLDPIVLQPGEGLRGVATYNNTTNETKRFGLLSTDEMMIIFGAYYND